MGYQSLHIIMHYTINLMSYHITENSKAVHLQLIVAKGLPIKRDRMQLQNNIHAFWLKTFENTRNYATHCLKFVMSSPRFLGIEKNGMKTK